MRPVPQFLFGSRSVAFVFNIDEGGVASINSMTGAYQSSNKSGNLFVLSVFAEAHQPVRPKPTGPIPKRFPRPYISIPVPGGIVAGLTGDVPRQIVYPRLIGSPSLMNCERTRE